MRAAWSRGDYGAVSGLTEGAAIALVDACAISAGQEVLDVGAGDGNAAVAAATEGAAVVASDLTPALVELGRARSEREGLDIEWVVADAEELPFEDGRFDCVVSVFGAMFAPRPEVAARELFRVTRPGNTVGMANWTPESYPGALFALTSRYLPPPPGMVAPVAWGVEETVRERFAGLAGSVEAERRVVRWSFGSPEEVLLTFEASTGPHIAAREAMGERYPEFRREGIELVERFNSAADSSVEIDCEYLLVVARRRG